VVANVRHLIERTDLTYSEISAKTGVGRASICRWARGGKWQRPAHAPRATDMVPTLRAGRRLKLRVEGKGAEEEIANLVLSTDWLGLQYNLRGACSDFNTPGLCRTHTFRLVTMADRIFAAFISHSSAQREFAARLQRWLEFEFDLPRRIVDDDPNAASKIRPVFRDVTDLAAHEHIHQALKAELDRSRVVILVCSAEAAASIYVDEEIAYFAATHPGRPILGVIAPGVLMDGVGGILPPSLRARHDTGHVPLLANAETEGEQTAFLRLAARLLGLDYGYLADRHGEHEREVRRQRSRLAAKTHTIPAEAAFLEGDAATALKHALAACIDGADYTWSQAPELEAMVREYVGRTPVVRRHAYRDSEGRRTRLVTAEPCGIGTLAAGFTNGQVLLIDSQTGDRLREFNGLDIWEMFDGRYPDSKAHQWMWFRRAWEPKAPLGSAYTSPDGGFFILTHGQTATSWSAAELQPTGLFMQEHYSLIRFHPTAPKAVLAHDASQYHSQLTVVDLDTGGFVSTQAAVWEPLDVAFLAKRGRQSFVVLSRSGEVIELDVSTAQEISRHRIVEGRIHFGALVDQGRAARLHDSANEGDRPHFFVRNSRGKWVPRDDPHRAFGPANSVEVSAVAPDGSSTAVYDRAAKHLKVVRRNGDVTDLPNLTVGYPVFAPDSARLVIDGEDDAVFFLHLTHETEPRRLDGKGYKRTLRRADLDDHDKTRQAIWSPDSSRFVTARHKVSRSSSLEQLTADLSGLTLFERALDIHCGETGRPLKIIASRGDQLDPVCFTPHSRGLWIVWNNWELRLIGLDEPRLVWSAKHEHSVKTFAVSPDGRYIAVLGPRRGKRRNGVVVYRADTGEMLKALSCRKEVAGTAFLDAETLAVSMDGGDILVVSVNGDKLGRYSDRKDDDTYPNVLCCSADGHILSASKEDGPSRVVVWRATGEAAEPIYTSPEVDASNAAISSDGRWVIHVDESGDGRIVDIQGEHGPHEIGLPFGHVFDIAFDLDDWSVWTANAFGFIEGLDLRTGDQRAFIRAKLLNPEYGIDMAAVSPAHGLVVMAEERLVQIIRLKTAERVILEEPGAVAQSPIALSPCGALVATGSTDSAIRLWRTSDGHCVSILRPDADYPEHLAFDPDGQHVVAAHDGGIWTKWDVRDAYLSGAEVTAWIAGQADRVSVQMDERDTANILLMELYERSARHGHDLLALFLQEARLAGQLL
jgi:WD40 repeat protein